MKKTLLVTSTIVISLVFAFLLGELFLFITSAVRASSKSFNALNGHFIHYSPTRGYRMDAGEHRFVRVMDGTVEFDNRFKINTQGYPSTRDYSLKKTTYKKRFLVFGDSFTAGLILKEAWPDVAQRMLDERMSGEVELFSFAIDGGGLANWHSTFFSEIVGKYDFDGIIIAALPDDFLRNFTAAHSKDNYLYLGRFSTAAKDETDFINNYIPGMSPAYSIMTDTDIDSAIQSSKFRLFSGSVNYKFPMLPTETRRLMKSFRPCTSYNADHYKGLYESPRLMSHKYIKLAYTNIDLFSDIVSWCKNNNKSTLLCYIPQKDNVTSFIKDRNFSMGIDERGQLDVMSIADAYHVSYFDGLKAFEEFKITDIDGKLWFKRDGHWAQEGSNAFAKAIRDFILDKWIPATDNNSTTNNLSQDNYLNRVSSQ